LASKKKSRRKKPGRKKSRKQDHFGLNLLKVLIGFTALVLLVAAAGLLAHHYLKRKGPVSTLPPPKVARQQHTAARLHEAIPKQDLPHTPARLHEPVPKQDLPHTPARPYEVFPKQDLPPAIPLPKPIPQVKGLPKVAIIIDDLGYDRRMAKKFLSLDNRLTFAVLPQAPHTRSIAKSIQKKGGELMLHLPMEPTEYPSIDPGPGALLSSMAPDELLAQLKKNLTDVPGIKGVNNHMGSKLTTDSNRLYQVFSVLKQEGLFFIDSRSTSDTVSRPSARLFQLRFAERDVFIDHDQTPDVIREQLRKLIRIAVKNGEAVGIAHPLKMTYQILKDMLPQLKKEVQLVPASQVVHVLS
jgi:polysaccharide deacetylase 2 family uncharacterized protein YibQ